MLLHLHPRTAIAQQCAACRAYLHFLAQCKIIDDEVRRPGDISFSCTPHLLHISCACDFAKSRSI